MFSGSRASAARNVTRASPKTGFGAAVKAKDSAVTVTSVRMDPDGSYDVFGTKAGANVMLEVSKDLKEVTLHLRRGMRWSDGHTFTADDVIFWREDINLDPDIGYPSITLSIDGKNVAVEKVDDYTVVFRSPVPYATEPDPSGPAKAATAVAIPYFQWDNRDGRAMRVWLPLHTAPPAAPPPAGSPDAPEAG